MTAKLPYTWKRRVSQLKMDADPPKTRKILFSLNTAKIERVFLAGDSNGCMLVIPEIFWMNEHIRLCQGRLPGINFEPYA
jgi:hypothetical protein